jgi:signal transduction histidine kinase
MKRALSLRTWLGLALALVVAVPILAGIASWAAAGSWQAGREAHRERQAIEAVSAAKLSDAAQRSAVVGRLESLGVQAQLGPNKLKLKAAGAASAKTALANGPILVTPGVETDKFRRNPAGFRRNIVSLRNVAGFLWVQRESTATRSAITLGAGLIALVSVLVLVVVQLRRWVLRPLAQLAADAEGIAGGELEVKPPATRAREVAEVGDALHGMAGTLREVLGSSAAAERERRFLVTAIAHDLRTPLFTLRGSLEALEHGVGDGRYLDRAQDKAAQLDRLVGDLFTFSRLEYTGEKFTFDEVDVADLARRAVDGVEPLAVARGCEVSLQGTSAGLVVNGDADALLRVLTNLLDNAIRHSHREVVLRAQRVNGDIRFEIADDGPGFAPEDLAHVFEPLFRSDQARPTATGGTGLGLAIARRLARAHGGDVEATNDPDGGARTTVVLPVPGDSGPGDRKR